MKPYYQDDAVTIYHGDCREVLPTLTCELIVTDPPYGIGMAYGDGTDDAPETHWDWFLPILALMRSASPQVVFTHRQDAIWNLPKPDHLCVWHKPFNLTFSIKGWQAKWEPVFVYGGKVTKVAAPHARRASSTDSWSFNTEPNVYGHPATKPLSLMKEIVSTFSGGVVDPFMGSGTTLRAAKDLGRKAIGIEIEERYCEIAAKRMQQEVLKFG